MKKSNFYSSHLVWFQSFVLFIFLAFHFNFKTFSLSVHIIIIIIINSRESWRLPYFHFKININVETGNRHLCTFKLNEYFFDVFFHFQSSSLLFWNVLSIAITLSPVNDKNGVYMCQVFVVHCLSFVDFSCWQKEPSDIMDTY